MSTSALPERIELGSLTLTRVRGADAPALARAVLASLEHLLPWMPWAAAYRDASRAPAAAAEFTARAERDWDAGLDFGYALREHAGPDVVGTIGAIDRIGAGGLEIGYWLAASHTGRGLMTRAAAGLTQAVLALDGVTHAQIHHDRANRRSEAVPRRLGYRHVGERPTPPELGLTPAQVGVQDLWRMNAEDFPASPACALLATLRAAEPAAEQAG